MPSWSWSVCALLFVLLSFSGCGPSKTAPPLYPVKGQVLNGGKTLSNGVVQFQPTQSGQPSALGEVQPDGSFELATIFEGRRLAGAVAGQHQVVVNFSPTGDGRSIMPTTMETPFTVQAGDNSIKIDVAKDKKR